MTESSFGAERRCSARNTVNQPVSLEFAAPGQGGIEAVHLEGRCVNISSEGMGMITKARLNTCDVLKLHLSISDMNVTLPILTEVKWLRQVDGEYQIGLQFLA